MKILLIEQNRVFQAILVQAAAERAIDLTSVATAAAGLAALETGEFDFICVTRHLPDADGLDLAEKIRALPAHAFVPLILLTADATPGLTEEALNRGITEVFHKQSIEELLIFITRFQEFNRPFAGKILYVEDSLAQAGLLKEQLAVRGLSVDWFDSGEAAWQAFLANDYELVVTDINLGEGMSGLALTNRIRRLPGAKGDTPILALSAFDDVVRRINLFHLGVNDYVAKPVSRQELVARVNNLVGRRQLLNEVRREARARFDRVLLDLAHSTLAARGDLSGALQEICTLSANVLAVHASIWLSEGDGRLVRRCCTNCAGVQPAGTPELLAKDFPGYFAALHEGRMLSIRDAVTHPASCELAVPYLVPSAVGALLDIPVRRHEHVLGVLCLENPGEPREWTAEEEAFAVSLGEQVARVLAAFEHWEAEQALHLAQQVMQVAPISIVITDAEQHIVFVNEMFEQSTGYSLADAAGKTPNILRSDRHDAQFFRDMWAALKNKGSWQGEVWDRRKNGEVYPKRLLIQQLANDQDEVTHYLGMSLDVSVEREQQAQIEYLAYHDSLTGLANRLLFSDRLGQALRKAARSESRVAVIFIDLDRFKLINDSFGHEVGDQLLREISNRIKRCVREEDTLCRQGGDEFLIIIDGFADTGGLRVICERIMAAVSEPVQLVGKEFLPQISMGISLFPEDADNESDLVKNADMAMYHAKSLGRNRYQFFTDELNQKTQLRANLESELRQALVTGEGFRMAFQPKIGCTSERLVGLEALVRWIHPVRGFVPPDLFIGVAEDALLIDRLGDWIVNAVLKQMAAWRDGPMAGIPVAINISPLQLRNPGFVARLGQAADALGVDRKLIELEITEGVFIGDIDGARLLLESIKQGGFKLTLDDFGSGYSSFSYLASLPLDALKVDREFVWNLGQSSRSDSVLKAIVALAQELDLELVAEGVETTEQAAWLQAAGADIAQGYFYGRPEFPDNLLKFEKFLLKDASN